jgi:hypothetical protein
MASPSPTSSSATQSGGESGVRKEEHLGDLLLRLGIEDDEINDLVFEDEEDAPVGGIKWMALVKVHTMNYFSAQTFE